MKPRLADLLFLLVLLPLVGALRFHPRGNPGHPVVLVPGDAGNQIEANLTGKPSVIHYTCYSKTVEFFTLWLNLQELIPVYGIDCFTDNMRLVFDPATGKSSNSPGVDTRIPGFGGTKTLEWIDPSNSSYGRYFVDLVNSLEAFGYRRGKDLLGAPYDWRKSPNELGDYYALLKTLIETTYRYHSNKKVVIVAHSMGNPVMMYFYHNVVDQDWKDKYLQSHVALAPPFGGSMQIIRLFSAGYNLNNYAALLSPFKLRFMQRTFTSSAFLFPNPNVWNANETLATVDDKGTYSTANVEQFYKDIGYPEGYDIYKVAGPQLHNLSAPGVEVHCVYGSGLATPEAFHWKKGYFPDYQPDMTAGDGDGTVNLRSAEVCKKWNKDNNAGKAVTYHNIAKAEHMAIMSNQQALDLVHQAAFGLLGYFDSYY